MRTVLAVALSLLTFVPLASAQTLSPADRDRARAQNGLGRGHMALKQYVSAISALNRCRDLYVAQVGRTHRRRRGSLAERE